MSPSASHTIVSNGEFERYSKYILLTLEELKKQQAVQDAKYDELHLTLIKEIGELRADIKVINTKISVRSAAWGAITGLVTTLTGLIVMFFKFKN